MHKTISLLAACVVLLAGCNRTGSSASGDSAASAEALHETHDGHDHETEGHDHVSEGPEHQGHDHEAAPSGHSGDEIVFPASQAAHTEFEVQEVTLAPFAEVIRTSGQVLAAQGDEVTLVAPVSGIVSFADVRMAEGTRVESSQRLFYVATRNVGSGDVLAKNAANYQKAKAAFERAERLLKDRIVSRAEYEQARAEYEQARTEYEALAKTQSVRGAAVSAPIAGYVTSLSVAEGDYVEIGQPLATVSQNRRLKLRAEVSQRYYNRLRTVQSANFTVPYDHKTYELSSLGGRLLSVGRMSTTGSTLIPVTFEFNNNGQILPGSYVEVFLLGAPMEEALAVPLSAITEQQGLYYVYVQLDEECYQRREVTLGADDGERVRILSGLYPGDRVVTRGAINIKMAAASNAIPAHNHSH